MAGEKIYSANDMALLIEQQNTALRQALIDFARELKAPDPEEAAAKAEAKARKLQIEKQRARDAVEAQRIVDARQENCQHRKENGHWNTAGICTSDGMIALICQMCFKSWKVKVSAENYRAIEIGDLSLAESAPPQEELAEVAA
jgi:hypothetical protein